MQALGITAYGSEEQIQHLIVPKPTPGENDLLIHVLAFSLNPVRNGNLNVGNSCCSMIGKPPKSQICADTTNLHLSFRLIPKYAKESSIPAQKCNQVSKS